MRIYSLNPLIVFRLLLIMLLLSGCRAALIRAMGIQAPRIETPETVREFLVSNKKSVEGVFYLPGEKDSTEKMIKLMNEWMETKLRFYNRSGELLVEKQPNDCAGVKFRTFLDSLENTYKVGLPGQAQLQNDLHFLRTLHSKQIMMADLPPADFYVVATWAKFLGKKNYKETIDWYESEINSRSKKIVLLKLNMDFMESWGFGKAGEKLEMRMGGRK